AIREQVHVNRVDILGVDGRFFALAENPAKIALKPGTVAIGERLAVALGAKVEDEIALRAYKPSLLSRDAPLASGKKDERETRRRTFTVSAVLSDVQLGRFSLRSDQAAPANAFVDLKELQQLLDPEGRRNGIASGSL